MVARLGTIDLLVAQAHLPQHRCALPFLGSGQEGVSAKVLRILATVGPSIPLPGIPHCNCSVNLLPHKLLAPLLPNMAGHVGRGQATCSERSHLSRPCFSGDSTPLLRGDAEPLPLPLGGAALPPPSGADQELLPPPTGNGPTWEWAGMWGPQGQTWDSWPSAPGPSCMRKCAPSSWPVSPRKRGRAGVRQSGGRGGAAKPLAPLDQRTTSKQASPAPGVHSPAVQQTDSGPSVPTGEKKAREGDRLETPGHASQLCPAAGTHCFSCSLAGGWDGLSPWMGAAQAGVPGELQKRRVPGGMGSTFPCNRNQ